MSARSVSSARPITDQDCEAWRRDPLRNPHTNRPIDAHGPTYVRFQRRCGLPGVTQPAPAPELPIQPRVAVPPPRAPPIQVHRNRIEEERIHFITSFTNSLHLNQQIPRRDAMVIADETWDNLILPSFQGNTQHDPHVLADMSEHLHPNTIQRIISPSNRDNDSANSSSRRSHRSSRLRSNPSPPQVPTVTLQPTPTNGPTVNAQASIYPTPFRTIENPGEIREIQLFRFWEQPQPFRFSKFEAERYVASRLRMGFTTYFDPQRMILQSFGNDLETLVNMCTGFGLNIQRRQDLPTIIYITDNMNSSVTLENFDKMIHAIRMNLTIVNPLTSRPVTRTLNSGTLYRNIIQKALTLGLDMYHIHPRARSNVPIVEWSGNPPNSHANWLYTSLPNFRIYRSIESIRPPQNTAPTAEETNQANPFSALESIAKTNIASTLTSPTDTEAGCVATLSGFQDPFKKFGNKLKKICSGYLKQCANLEQIKQNLLHNRAFLNTPHRSFRSIQPEYTLASAFKQWLRETPSNRKRLMLANISMLSASYSGQAGVGPGVVNSFVQRMMDELTHYKVFISSQGEPTNRYFINPLFYPDDNFKRITDIRFQQEDDFILFYTFIGHLLNFIIINNISLNIKLSYNILAHMLYKHEDITDDDYVGYAMMDFPTEFNTYANLMKNPDWIPASDLSFNDTFPLREEDEPVTVENFRTYLRETSKYRYLRKPFSEDQQPGAPDINQRFMGMVKGMQPIRKLLRKEGVTVTALDKLYTSTEISNTTVNLLIENITSHLRLARERSVYDSLERTITSILQDRGETFPYDVIGIERPSSAEERNKEFLKFVERLLMFWSSYRRYNPSTAYRFSIIDPKHTDAGRHILRRRGQNATLTEQETLNILPESHTCFVRIDIPDTYYFSRDILYRKLVQACSMAEAGIGNYGGSKKTTHRKTK